ncbi:hypothetical protein CAEBREN_14799 [Caenorhabditis brenneri]|uniref:Uncharacterized protein n=1 Tax=Caenorhabditis brenneri TaxID=135651 RepID=G0MWB1_CAEBE|nr:hypothetical protein CAEBREN_14799 [Caenorhabditis brenneri]
MLRETTTTNGIAAETVSTFTTLSYTYHGFQAIQSIPGSANANNVQAEDDAQSPQESNQVARGRQSGNCQNFYIDAVFQEIEMDKEKRDRGHAC